MHCTINIIAMIHYTKMHCTVIHHEALHCSKAPFAMMHFTKIHIIHTTVKTMMLYNDEICTAPYCHNVLHNDALRQGFTWSDTDCVNTRAAPLCQRHATTTTSTPTTMTTTPTTMTTTPTTMTTTPTTTTTADSVYECTGNWHLQLKYHYSSSLFH